MKAVISIALIAGFLYAGRATGLRYYEIFRAPVTATPSSSIDEHLRPMGMKGADDFRQKIAAAGWPAGENVLVLAASPTITRQELYQFYYSAAYVMYPSRVWVAEGESPQEAIVHYRARRVLVLGGHNPFPHTASTRLSHTVLAVSVR